MGINSRGSPGAPNAVVSRLLSLFEADERAEANLTFQNPELLRSLERALQSGIIPQTDAGIVAIGIENRFVGIALADLIEIAQRRPRPEQAGSVTADCLDRELDQRLRAYPRASERLQAQWSAQCSDVPELAKMLESNRCSAEDARLVLYGGESLQTLVRKRTAA